MEQIVGFLKQAEVELAEVIRKVGIEKLKQHLEPEVGFRRPQETAFATRQLRKSWGDSVFRPNTGKSDSLISPELFPVLFRFPWFN